MRPTEDDTAVRPLDHGGRLGPYTLVAPVGAGGMGVVYRAHDERLGRDVAIKVIRPGLLASDAARRRFRIEALALGKLNHPNIATVYDAGTQDGADYLVMELISGQTLKERLESDSLSMQESVTLASEIASALEEAHEHSVIHRDLKPGNIIVTPKGHAKILDFGLAKMLGTNPNDETHPLIDTGVVGTPSYMSPEQAEGRPVDARTDLWSLGVVLYEALAGRVPFRGESGLAVLRAITQEEPDPLRNARWDVPADAVRIVSRALEKHVDKRYQSAAEMGRDLAGISARLSAPDLPRSSLHGGPLAIGVAVLLAAAAGAGWFYHRSERMHWAREQAIPQIRKDFDESRSLAGFGLLNEAELLLPGDPTLAAMFAKNTRNLSIESLPQGATVEVQDYLAPETPWLRLGVTPLRNVRVPNGYFRWRVSKPNVGELLLAPLTRTKMTFDLDAQKSEPAGMKLVEGGEWADMIAFVGWVGPYELQPYYIDRTEVTNRDYQTFVDSGGYAKHEYWRETFLRDGRELTWEEAMSALRDRSGRAGPSTWEGGHYPAGQDDYPVSGVSWYEAAAYAAYAGKSLPVFAQWFRAMPTGISAAAIPQSNISRNAMAPVGTFGGIGPFGTVDMIGNVREWIANSDDNHSRFILGGAWSSLPYLASDPESLPPFDRSPTNGMRCVRNTAPLSAQVAAPITTQRRDFDHYKPASDDTFRAYEAMYAYDKRPLNAESNGVIETTADWRKEKITFDAAYDGERVIAYLFLPKKIKPPFQTVVFFPSARVLYLDNSSTLGDLQFFDYIIQSGRAVMYPVYKGTYERQDTRMLPGTRGNLDLVIRQFKDLGRSIDYLTSRPDIDTNRLAYLGVSMGAAQGVIYCTLAQDAFKTVIFLDGGYFLNRTTPGGDQADFAPRLKKPVLMVNGRYDFTFPLAKSQEPLFRTLGADAALKRHVVLDTPHDVSAKKTDLVQAVLPWLDKYLGRSQ